MPFACSLPPLPWVCPYSQCPGLHAPFPFSHIPAPFRPACPLDSWMNEFDKMIRSSCYKQMKGGEQEPTEMLRNPTGARYWGAPAGRNSLNSHSILFRGESGPYTGNGVWERKDALWGDAPPCSWSWEGAGPTGCVFVWGGDPTVNWICGATFRGDGADHLQVLCLGRTLEVEGQRVACPGSGAHLSSAGVRSRVPGESVKAGGHSQSRHVPTFTSLLDQALDTVSRSHLRYSG